MSLSKAFDKDNVDADRFAVPFLFQPGGGLPPVLGLRFRMLLEVLVRGEVVAAAGLVVASTYCFVDKLVCIIYIGGEAVGPFALGTAEPGCFSGVFDKVIAVFHGQSSL